MRSKWMYVLAASLPALSSGVAHSETLQDAMIRAYGSNPTLEAERASAQATDEALAQARGAFLPTLDFGANSGRQIQDSAGTRVFGGVPFSTESTTRGYNYGLDLTLRQDLWTSGRNVGTLGQAKAQVLAARAGLESTEQRILLEVVTAFMDVRRDAEALKVRIKNVEVLTKQLEAARDRFTVGEITRTDVAQAEARLSGAQSAVAAAQAALDTSNATYQSVVGAAPDDLAPPPPLRSLPKTLDEAFVIAQEINPDLLRAKFNLQGQQQAVKRAEAGLLPQVSLQGSVSRDESRGTLVTRSPLANAGTTATANLGRTATIGAQLTLPIFDAGIQRSLTRQAKLNVAQMKAREEETRRSVIQQTASAWADYVAAKAQIEASEQQVKANEVAFEGVSQELQVGLRTTLDVLDAQQELLNSRLALIQAERNYYVAQNVVMRSIGRLTAEDIGLEVPIYDPAAYSDKIGLSPIKGAWLGTSPPKVGPYARQPSKPAQSGSAAPAEPEKNTQPAVEN